MEKDALEYVCKNIYQRFPTLNKSKPKISKQSDNRFLLVFSGSGETPDGKSIQQKVRVVATGDGKIIKTSMSK